MKTPSPLRSTLHVDVGAELKARLRAAAAALGRTPSQWTIELIQRELASAGAPATSSTPAGATKPGRVVLDAELSSLLDQVRARGQFRTRPAALRLALKTFVGQEPAAPQRVDAAPLKDAVAALMRSNHELLPIGTNINQIAKSLHAMQGSFGAGDAAQLASLAGSVRAHVDVASRLTADLRGLLTPHRS